MTSSKNPVASTPRFARLSYFHGQMLGPHDLQGESAYQRECRRLANRALHGWGVVCGFDVDPVEPGKDCAAPEPESAFGVSIVDVGRGIGYDCHGDHVVLRDVERIDLWRALGAAERARVEAGDADTVYVSVCYHECPVDPARPVVGSGCAVPMDCAHARVQESACVRVGLTPPDGGPRCEPCGGGCPDPCLLLATVRGFRKGEPVVAGMIDAGVRRMITRHRLTTITGISWAHGATYPSALADRLLAGDLEVRFSDPVLVDTVLPGVVEVTVVPGGSGRRGDPYIRGCTFVGLPGSGLTDRIRFRVADREKVNEGDTVRITVRADFVLDECCRAVDGNHIGGRVPVLADCAETYGVPERGGPCSGPPDRPGAWTSGNGVPGGVFESWFFVELEEETDDD